MIDEQLKVPLPSVPTRRRSRTNRTMETAITSKPPETTQASLGEPVNNSVKATNEEPESRPIRVVSAEAERNGAVAEPPQLAERGRGESEPRELAKEVDPSDSPAERKGNRRSAFGWFAGRIGLGDRGETPPLQSDVIARSFPEVSRHMATPESAFIQKEPIQTMVPTSQPMAGLRPEEAAPAEQAFSEHLARDSGPIPVDGPGSPTRSAAVEEQVQLPENEPTPTEAPLVEQTLEIGQEEIGLALTSDGRLETPIRAETNVDAEPEVNVHESMGNYAISVSGSSSISSERHSLNYEEAAAETPLPSPKIAAPYPDIVQGDEELIERAYAPREHHIGMNHEYDSQLSPLDEPSMVENVPVGQQFVRAERLESFEEHEDNLAVHQEYYHPPVEEQAPYYAGQTLGQAPIQVVHETPRLDAEDYHVEEYLEPQSPPFDLRVPDEDSIPLSPVTYFDAPPSNKEGLSNGYQYTNSLAQPERGFNYKEGIIPQDVEPSVVRQSPQMTPTLVEQAENIPDAQVAIVYDGMEPENYPEPEVPPHSAREVELFHNGEYDQSVHHAEYEEDQYPHIAPVEATSMDAHSLVKAEVEFEHPVANEVAYGAQDTAMYEPALPIARVVDEAGEPHAPGHNGHIDDHDSCDETPVLLEGSPNQHAVESFNVDVSDYKMDYGLALDNVQLPNGTWSVGPINETVYQSMAVEYLAPTTYLRETIEGPKDFTAEILSTEETREVPALPSPHVEREVSHEEPGSERVISETEENSEVSTLPALSYEQPVGAGQFEEYRYDIEDSETGHGQEELPSAASMMKGKGTMLDEPSYAVDTRESELDREVLANSTSAEKFYEDPEVEVRSSILPEETEGFAHPLAYAEQGPVAHDAEEHSAGVEVSEVDETRQVSLLPSLITGEEIVVGGGSHFGDTIELQEESRSISHDPPTEKGLLEEAEDGLSHSEIERSQEPAVVLPDSQESAVLQGEPQQDESTNIEYVNLAHEVQPVAAQLPNGTWAIDPSESDQEIVLARFRETFARFRKAVAPSIERRFSQPPAPQALEDLATLGTSIPNIAVEKQPVAAQLANGSWVMDPAEDEYDMSFAVANAAAAMHEGQDAALVDEAAEGDVHRDFSENSSSAHETPGLESPASITKTPSTEQVATPDKVELASQPAVADGYEYHQMQPEPEYGEVEPVAEKAPTLPMSPFHSDPAMIPDVALAENQYYETYDRRLYEPAQPQLMAPAVIMEDQGSAYHSYYGEVYHDTQGSHSYSDNLAVAGEVTTDTESQAFVTPMQSAGIHTPSQFQEHPDNFHSPDEYPYAAEVAATVHGQDELFDSDDDESEYQSQTGYEEDENRHATQLSLPPQSSNYDAYSTEPTVTPTAAVLDAELQSYEEMRPVEYTPENSTSMDSLVEDNSDISPMSLREAAPAPASSSLSRGLAFSRHNPERPVTPPGQMGRPDNYGVNTPDVPWDASGQIDSTPMSLVSQSTISTASESPVHAALPIDNHEPVIRDSWPAPMGQFGDRHDAHVPSPLQYHDTPKSFSEENLPTPIATQMPHNVLARNSPTASPSPPSSLIQKMRSIFETPSGGSGVDSAASSPSRSRPSSGIFNMPLRRARTAGPVSPGYDIPGEPRKGGFLNEAEDEIDERSALLRTATGGLDEN